MKRIFLTSFLITALATGGLRAQTATNQGPLPRLGKNSVKEVVAAMTLEEKASLLVGMGINIDIPGVSTMAPEDRAIPEKVPGAAGRTRPIPRLGIPSLTLSDGPAGVRIDPKRKGDESRTYYATAFPVATLLASSWDADLVHRVGAAFGEETRDYGVDILLAPGMNLHRNPLGGRNFEYYSEDPLVTGKMAAAFVRGVQSQGVGTSVKHFAANNQEFNRMQSDSVVSERALREIYLKGFEIAVKESQPWTVMSSYNLINGTYTSQSPELLDTVLRDEWGFKGFVMTDWVAGNNVAEQLKAGNDVIMPGSPARTKAILDAVRAGELRQQQLDENVERVLNVILQSPTFKGHRHSNQPDLKTHAQVAREAAAEGMVLLRNEGAALPLSSPRKVALYGIASYDLVSGGTGSGDVNEAYTVSLDKGMADSGYSVEPSLRESYTQYITDQKAKRPKPQFILETPTPIREMPLEAAGVEQKAGETDAAIITIGRNAGEGGDRKVEGDFTLTDAEQAMIKTVSDAFRVNGKKVVVVLNVGGPVEVASWRERADAILLTWQPGQEGGNAIADVLSGKVNPSGKLATTFPVRYEDVPSARTFPGRELPDRAPLMQFPIPALAALAGKPAEAVYEEGIYVGYRYYDTFNVRPAYAFGHGLSYTNFTYGDLKLSSKRFGGKLTATVRITNTGKVAGKEVVQVYVGAPAGRLDKPKSELRAFAKTRLLRPAESETLTFELGASDLASFDPARSSWLADAGNYTVKVGASSADIRRTATFGLAKEIVVSKANRVLVPRVAIREIRPDISRPTN
jgi:beta-glucosidase